MSKMYVSIRLVNYCFDVFVKYHVSVTITFRGQDASSICSIFPQRIESIALLKSTNNRAGSMCFARTPSMIRQIFRICEVAQFLLKPLWFFQRIFYNFGSNKTEIQDIINLLLNSCNCYASVVLNDSEVGKDATFCSFLYWVLFIDCVA